MKRQDRHNGNLSINGTNPLNPRYIRSTMNAQFQIAFLLGVRFAHRPTGPQANRPTGQQANRFSERKR